jgi:hypothetical protein
MPQLLRPRPTHRQARTVQHFRDELAARTAPECANEVEIHDVRTVNAQKSSCIESQLEACQREVQQVP